MGDQDLPGPGAVRVELLSGAQATCPYTEPQVEEASALLERIRAGDRTALALFVARYESCIRRRIRGKLTAPMRSVFDVEDILATLGRRLDLFMLSGRLKVASENELEALVCCMAEQCVQQKARVFRRSRRCDLRGGQVLRRPLQAGRDGGGSGLDFDRVLGCLEDVIDRQILAQWVDGVRQRAIAAQLGLAPSAVRKRWQRIKHQLQVQLGREVLP